MFGPLNDNDRDVIVTEGSFVLKSEFAKALLQEDD